MFSFFKRKKKVDNDFSSFTTNNQTASSSQQTASNDETGKYQDFIESLLEEIKCEAVQLDVTNEDTTVFNSKIGGAPYFPKGQEYPRITNEDVTLHLIAQINFDEMPNLDGFPETGMLQFFIADEDAYGLFLKDAFKVIYHQQVSYELANQAELPEIGKPKAFPTEGVYKLNGKITKEYMSHIDYRFEQIFENKKDEFNLPHDLELDEIAFPSGELLVDTLLGSGTSIGGSPFFTKEDPRQGDEYEVTLLQIDSIWSKNEGIDIMWGDSGICNFFISKADLKNKDFSNVLYNWDCY